MEKQRSKKEYGFVRPQIGISDHIFGAVELGAVLKPDGQWDDFLPTYEPQAEKYETYGCTVWGTQNALEILHKFLFKNEINADERYNYNCIAIEPPGSDPHKAAQSIKNEGLTFGLLPVTETYEEFCTPRPMEVKYEVQGAKFTEQYSFRHQWVLQGKESKETRIAWMKDALRYSPLGVSVSAWYEKDGVYVDNGQPNNHWCVCYGWIDKDWKIFDSYDHSIKVYSFDSKITFAKRYSLEKITKRYNWFVRLLQSIFFVK